VKTTAGELSTTLETYLEAISELQELYGAVRVTDLADRMGCRRPTVTSALLRLSKLHLIRYESYRPVTLTAVGEATVRRLDGRHRVLADFLSSVLAMREEAAETEACQLEHRVSREVLRRLWLFMVFVRSQPILHKDLAALRVSFAEFLARPRTKAASGPKAATGSTARKPQKPRKPANRVKGGTSAPRPKAGA